MKSMNKKELLSINTDRELMSDNHVKKICKIVDRKIIALQGATKFLTSYQKKFLPTNLNVLLQKI